METAHTQQNDAYWGSVIDGSTYRSWRYWGALGLFAVFAITATRLLIASYAHAHKNDFAALIMGVAALALLNVWTLVRASKAIYSARLNNTPELRNTALVNFRMYYLATWFSAVVSSVALIFYK